MKSLKALLQTVCVGLLTGSEINGQDPQWKWRIWRSTQNAVLLCL